MFTFDSPVTEEPHHVSSSWALHWNTSLKMKSRESVRRHAPEETNRATAALPQACSGNLETNPERAREEPRRAPNVTGPGRQREWLTSDVHVRNALSAPCQYTKGNARGARAETAAHAAGTAGTTRRGASRRLKSKPPVWVFQARCQLTPGYATLLL